MQTISNNHLMLAVKFDKKDMEFIGKFTQ